MGLRFWGWLAGFAMGCVVALAAPDGEALPLRPLLFGAGFLGIGLSVELIDFLRGRAQTRRAWERLDRRAADGRVEIARVPGVLRRTNEVDPRYGRFVERERPQTGTPDRATFGELWDGRTSPALVGRVGLISVFLGQHGRTWSDDEIADAHGVLTRVGQWIEREASRWNVGVNIELADTYFALEDEPDASEDDSSPTDTPPRIGFPIESTGLDTLLQMSRMAARLGFHDLIEMFDDFRSRLDADSLVWLIHPRGAGWSFAVPREYSPWDRISLAVCFPRWASHPAPISFRDAQLDPITVAHELMHLFGASDKYQRPASAFPPRLVTANDVMRLSDRRFQRLRVDPRTALEIGWARQGQPFPAETPAAGAIPEELHRPLDIVIEANELPD